MGKLIESEGARDLLLLALLWFGFSWLFITASRMFEWGGNELFIQWLLEVSGEATKYGLPNIWTPYPTLATLIFHGIYLLTGGNSFLYWLSFKILNLSCNFAVIGFTYLIARTLYGRVTARWVALVLTFLFPPFYFNVFVNYVFDSVPVAFMMFAFYLLIKERYVASALFAAIGGGIKLFPLVVVLISLKYLWGQRQFKEMGKSILACLLALSPLLVFLSINPTIFSSTYRWQIGRPPNETIYNFILWSVNASLTVDERYYVDYTGQGLPTGPPVLARPLTPIVQGEMLTVTLPSEMEIGDHVYINVTVRPQEGGRYKIGLITTGIRSNRSGRAVFTPWIDMQAGGKYRFTGTEIYHEVWAEPIEDRIWIEKDGVGKIDEVMVVIELGRLFASYFNIGSTPSPRILHLPVNPESTVGLMDRVQTAALVVGAIIALYAFVKMSVRKEGVITIALFLFCVLFIVIGQWSPQFALWVLPLILLWRKRGWFSDVAAIGLATIVNIEYPYSFEGYELTQSASFAWMFWASIILRTAVFVLICLQIWMSRGKSVI